MMETIFGLCLLVGVAVTFCGAYEYDPNYLTKPQCKPCDAKSCPELTFCAGTKVKDHCGCCHRCSSDLFQPHIPARQPDLPARQPIVLTPEPDTKPSQEAACKERKCGKFKICVFNLQKLPICTCPSVKVCRPRRGKRAKFSKDLQVCGTDGNTYESRCHMRIANCNNGKRIRRKHVGKCITAQTGSPPIAVEPVTRSSQLQSLDPTMSPEAIKKIKRAERRRKRKQMKRLERKRKKDLKRKMRKENKRKARREMERRERKKIQRRKKRMNNSYSVYSRDYGYLLGKHTTWGRSQVRKSRI